MDKAMFLERGTSLVLRWTSITGDQVVLEAGLANDAGVAGQIDGTRQRWSEFVQSRKMDDLIAQEERFAGQLAVC
jgi:hypothetical protein